MEAISFLTRNFMRNIFTREKIRDELHRGRDFLPPVESHGAGSLLEFLPKGRRQRGISESGHGKERKRCVELAYQRRAPRNIL